MFGISFSFVVLYLIEWGVYLLFMFINKIKEEVMKEVIIDYSG